MTDPDQEMEDFTRKVLRAHRVDAVGWRPPNALQTQSTCPVCSVTPDSYELGVRDRYGFSIRAVSHCQRCGHRWIVDYMGKPDTAAFYASGAYQRLTDAYAGVETTPERLHSHQLAYARELISALAPHVAPGSRLLDVGGAPGTMARELCDALVLPDPVVVDPASALDDASARQTMLWDSADLVVISRTIDHVVDPSSLLADAWNALSRGGVLWIDIADYESHPVVKWDHPQMFCDQSIRTLLGRSRFGVVHEIKRGTQVHDGGPVVVNARAYIARRQA